MLTEITAKTILRKSKKLDSWFLTRYGMNLYRGCTHDCSYCDGRSEEYRVEGTFGADVGVKVNAVDVLARELDPARRRVPLKRCFMMLGGGVGDAYQPAEERYCLARRTLELLEQRNWPVHILTKSTLVMRDLDIIKRIHDKNRALVSFSFSTADDRIAAVFEPGVPPPSERLDALLQIRAEGIPAGMFLMPVIPFITDTPARMDQTFKAAHDAGADYVVFAGMTLKAGRQRDHFYQVLDRSFPDKTIHYHNIYTNDKWGRPSTAYLGSADGLALHLAKKYAMPLRIPIGLCRGVLSENDRVQVILEHLDYLLRIRGHVSPYRNAAWKIAQVKGPLSDMFGELRQIDGVGKTTEKLIKEILRTGTCGYYDALLYHRST